MYYHHLAHFDSLKSFVKKGKKIKKGEIIGTVGKSGTRYAHCHYEVHRVKPTSWAKYTRGMSKAQVLAHYVDPVKWIDKKQDIPAKYTTYGGWEFMDQINNAGEFHPGVDINDSYGDKDLGNPVRSPVSGEIVFRGEHTGWGTHIFIHEDVTLDDPVFDFEFAKRVAGRMFLQVEEHGEAWYVDQEGTRWYMGKTPEDMLEFVKRMAQGISNADLNKIPKG